MLGESSGIQEFASTVSSLSKGMFPSGDNCVDSLLYSFPSILKKNCCQIWNSCDTTDHLTNWQQRFLALCKLVRATCCVLDKRSRTLRTVAWLHGIQANHEPIEWPKLTTKRQWKFEFITRRGGRTRPPLHQIWWRTKAESSAVQAKRKAARRRNGPSERERRDKQSLWRLLAPRAPGPPLLWAPTSSPRRSCLWKWNSSSRRTQMVT